MVLKQKEREMVAYHEAGHTIVHLQTSLLPPLYKVSIVPRGGALGVTLGATVGSALGAGALVPITASGFASAARARDGTPNANRTNNERIIRYSSMGRTERNAV